jgi:hypothetical protein
MGCLAFVRQRLALLWYSVEPLDVTTDYLRLVQYSVRCSLLYFYHLLHCLLSSVMLQVLICRTQPVTDMAAFTVLSIVLLSDLGRHLRSCITPKLIQELMSTGVLVLTLL